MNTVMLPMDVIFADSDFNCRGAISRLDVMDLMKSIQDIGLQQPVVVQAYNKKPPYKYRIVMGHRRYTACKYLKMKDIPCIIREGLNDLQLRTLNLIENLERKSLTIMQEAKAIAHFHSVGMTLTETAKMINQSTGWVQVRYMALSMPPEIQAEIHAGLLTQENIRDLAALTSTEAKYSAIRQLKDAKLKGEKYKIREKKKFKKPGKRIRTVTEMFHMQDHIADNIGNNIGTRALAWAAGVISDDDLCDDIKEIALEQGKTYVSFNEHLSKNAM